MPQFACELLCDDQVRRFITDGYLVLPPVGSEELHQRIDERMLWLLHKEGNPGNNVLPAIPEMYAILEAPQVRGALTSILGPNYVLHPHRYAHNNEPGKLTAEGAKVGEGSHSFVGWHQDSHSPLSRPRHHYCRYAMLLYYPQDTPEERGPTQLIPGTHLNRSLSEEEKQRGILAAGPAGSCVLVHFDIVHGGSLNLSDRTRTMVKFVFARTQEPTEPSWDCRESAWQNPEGRRAPMETPVVWQHQWDWLSGRVPGRYCPPAEANATQQPLHTLVEQLAGGQPLQMRLAAAHSLAVMGPEAAEALPVLLTALEAEEPLRQTAIYSLAAIGAPAVGPLEERLRGCERNGWNEAAVVMEDAAYALAAIGNPAIPALIGLLVHSNPWVQINAAFALGEMGARAAEAVPALITLLGHPEHAVVRTTLDALGQIRTGAQAALPEIRRLLTESNPNWQSPLYRAWTGENQVRTNAMMTLLRMGDEAAGAEVWASAALNDACGYVGGFGIEYLLRRSTPEAQQAALRYLYTHRWDNTLRQGLRTY